ncbi:efflux RND transporter periplasmic adaptor subunit [Sphingobacterium oryzagri]|uniref:Efflux RND transporter periplasmic adaptor subunit n=1 Tax=Sphingobacterium oryzagri TaxID=3025669 RepID=A0ABY7WFN9_9SPHI|nr:efflux RND transporter periplasmic adaptor subunit [Sphingobacterium sp. KACC 22765]WDF68449.1 efflux RND transporter periplasmic adaptor subunit [Sphingobacterium sp. KACC 22765]
MFQSIKISLRKGKQYFPIIFLFGLVACHSTQNQQPGGPQNTVQEYPVFIVEEKTTTLFQEYPATIQGQQDIDIRPKIDGYVENIYVDEGSRVVKGQKLFSIFNPQYQQDLSSAEGAVASAKADVNTADLAVRKAKPLVDREIISKYELESAEYTLEARKAALKQAEATLANARVNVAYTQIASPVDGIVGTIPFRTGSYVSSLSTDPLTTVSNTGNVYVYFSLNEKQLLNLSKLLPGKNIDEKIKNMPPVKLIMANGEEYPESGRIETLSGQISTETGAATLRANFANPKAIIRSGGTGKIQIPQTVENAILIPQQCTYELQGKRFAYLVDAEGVVKSTELTVMSNTTGGYFVTTAGVKAGDKIVYEGVQTLHDNMKIQPKAIEQAKVYDTTAL